MAASPHDGVRALSFSVSLSAEPAFADTAGALAARAGDYAGCAADDARRLGDAVRTVFGTVVAGEPYTDVVEVIVHGTDRLVRIEVWCASGATLVQRMAANGGPDPVSALVDRVEFGTDGPRGYCRLTQQIRPAR
ncbi:MAG: hypothetical protein MUF60_08785 [Vicinamibacterales bacterium]|jgi:hypothetical protein|nr:hypothetical protein [Vicinamibacterales bacterium]